MIEQYPNSPENEKPDRPSSQEEPEEKDDKFDREYYEPDMTTQANNIIGWTIATVLFILAAWLLWVALR